MQKPSNKQRSLADQLKEQYKAGEDSLPPNKLETDVNASLAKEFEKWLTADEKEANRQPPSKGSLGRNKARYGSVSPEPEQKSETKAARPLSGMDSRRIYEQLTIKQKKEIAWLLRDEGLV